MNNKKSRHKLSIRVLKITIIMVILMSIYEYSKSFILPSITLWQSHLITIIISGIIAAMVSYFVFRKENNFLNEILNEQKHKTEYEKQLEATIAELTTAKSEINALEGLLPICSFCKSIRNEDGQWVSIEKYIRSNSGADFSHSVCPVCMKKHYPQIDNQ